MWCSIILVFLFLTGTLSVIATEIDWLLDKNMRVSSEGRPKIELSQTFGAADAALNGKEIYRVYRYDESWVADLVEFQADGGLRNMWVDPYSGTAIGDSSTTTFKEIIGSLHSNLMIPTRLGILLVTVFSFALLASLIAGIFLLPKFWKSFVIRPRFGASKRAFYSDLHRLAGAWSIPFVAVVSLTGVYYFAERVNLDAPAIDRGVNTEPRETKQPADLGAAKISAAITAAKKIYPDLKIKHIILPRNRVQPIRIQGDMTATLVRERANAVYLHPETLDVIRAHKGEDLSAHQRISEAVDPLHWGFWGGTASKIIWFVFGLILTALPIAGAVIFAKRMGVRRAKLEGVNHSDWKVYWDGMGLGKWGAIALVAVGLALTLKTIFIG